MSTYFSIRQRLLIIISILSFWAKTYSQTQAFIHIKEDNTYPANIFTKTAQKQYSWIFNGKNIEYRTGQYSIPIHNSDQFDTIIFQQRYKHTGTVYRNRNIFDKYIHRLRRPTYDTIKTIILCKFRENHNYKLGEIYPRGYFDLFSLDTLQTRKTFTIRVINKTGIDTLYLNDTYPKRKIFSDTTITISNINEKLEQNFLQHILLENVKSRPDDFDPRKINGFEFYYNYLHADNLEIIYDCATKKYNLKLLN